MKNDEQFQAVKSTFDIVGLLKACAAKKDLIKGSKLHACIRQRTFLENDSHVASALVNMYAKCGALAKAQEVLKELPVQNVVMWNALISGYAQQGKGAEALKCYDSMQCAGHFANAITFTCALKACAITGAVARGEQIHNKIVNLGILEENIMLGNALVNMYAKCGALAKAQQVLEELPGRDTVTWSTLIAGYTQQGQEEEALKCFDSMQHEGHSPDALSFSYALQACGSIGAVVKGEQIYNKLVSLEMLEKNFMLGNTLMDMYIRFGVLTKAQQVLEGLPVRNVVTWNALMAGFTQHGQGEEALKCYDSMQCEGHSPDVGTFIYALKACGSIGAVVKGEEIHNKIVSLGILDKNIVLGNILVDMYCRCGALAKAQQVLEGLPLRNVVTWNALIGGYAQHGEGEGALKCYDSMQRDGHSPDVVTFICTLKACGSIGAAVKGEEIHDKITSLGMLEKDILLGNSLVDMYVRCGALAKAEHVLERLLVRDVVTWSTLIAGYTQHGQGQEALKCFDNMQREGHSLDAVTFACALKACGIVGDIAKGEQIHDKIVSLGMLEKDVVLGNSLVDMYARCGALAKAQQVLEGLSVRNVVTWSTLIAGYTLLGQGQDALKCYDSMQREGHCPDPVTAICVLKACGIIGAAAKGEQIHDMIVSLGMLEQNILIGNTIVDMYAKCGALSKAQEVLKGLPVRDVFSWSALIAGYVQHGQAEEALKCFDSMQGEGHSPDTVAFTCALKACGIIGEVVKGEQIHNKIVSLGMLGKDIALGNTLVDMYARYGALSKAQQVLEGLPVRNVVTWNALIGGYVQQGEGEEALRCYDNMQNEGHSPNAVSFICALKACGSIGAAAKGEQIHREIVSFDMVGNNSVLGSTLVVMYAKCAVFSKALEVFKELSLQDVVTWNALIGAYAEQGQILEALNCFETMLSKGVKPNSITLICLLNACSHSGLLDQAEIFVWTMSTRYDIIADVEHYCCMLDLFGRAKQLKKALTVIEKMPSADCLPVWVSLLGACCKWGEVKIGRLAFEHALHLDKSDTMAYVYMANIYITAGMQED